MTTGPKINGKLVKARTHREGIHISHSLSNERIDGGRFSNSTFTHNKNGQSAHTLQVLMAKIDFKKKSGNG